MPLVCSRSNPVFVAYVTLFFVTPLSAAADDCVCTSGHLADTFASAERIFKGTIVDAELDDPNDSVNFSVVVDAVYRGAVETTMQLSTVLEGVCRVNVYAGARPVFMLNKNDSVVSRCDGPESQWNAEDPFFSAAVDLVENYAAVRASATSDIRSWLKAGAGAFGIRTILATANELNPSVFSPEAVNELSYRGLKVRIVDGRVVSYDWN